jgi:uncharacterized protein (TIGR02145 family)
MKKIYIIVVALFLSVFTFAQIPQLMSYQAVIRDVNNKLVENQAVGMRVSLLQGTVTGPVVYEEIYNPNPSTNANGLVNIQIGGGIATIGTFSAIDWSAGTYFLKIETDPTGGTNYTITGTSQLLSVPYALYAKTAGNSNVIQVNSDWNATSGTSQILNKPTLSIVAISGSYTDLTNSPTIPANQVNSDWKATSGITQIINKPTLAMVASSGSYYDLNNTPNLQVSKTGDTLYFGVQNVIIPGISIANIVNINSNIYKTVILGTQTWMTENLHNTTYNDGTPIPNIKNTTTWFADTLGALCTYNNTTNADTIKTDGILYNWYAVNTGKLCPKGWHVPNDSDWSILLDYLRYNYYGYGQAIGTATYNYVAKSMASTNGWISSTINGAIGNTSATNNSSAFTAQAAGIRQGNGAYIGFGYNCYWWSTTESSSIPIYWILQNNNSNLIQSPSTNKNEGISVRCLKD